MSKIKDWILWRREIDSRTTRTWTGQGDWESADEAIP